MSHSRHSLRLGQTGRVVVLGALASLAACDGRSSGARADDDPQLVSVPADSSHLVYRSEVDEGLGVALDIVLDNSGSMGEVAPGDERPKYVVAREAIERMLDATDAAVAKRPDFPVLVALHVFSGRVETVLPMQPYRRDSVRAALARISMPDGGTAIGRGIDAARRALYRSGVYRKNVLVVTDGENTSGPSPDSVARELFERSEGAVRMYFVAFDVDADNFAFVKAVRGEVVGAANGRALAAALDSLYQGHVLAEALDAGEGPRPADSATAAAPARRHSTATAHRNPKP